MGPGRNRWDPACGQTRNPLKKIAHQIVANPKFKESFKRHMKDTEVDAFIATLDELFPEEMAAVRTAASSA